MIRVTLPFPASILAGHANGNARWAKIEATKKHRRWAMLAAKEAGSIDLPPTGDISVLVIFTPANNRGDRINFSNRMKPYFDGIADALGVNDSRFVPSFEYRDACKPGGVVVEIKPLEAT